MIKPKYNLGQTVYTKRYEAIQNIEVKRFEIGAIKLYQGYIIYANAEGYDETYEQELYPSKESLYKDMLRQLEDAKQKIYRITKGENQND